MSEVRVTIPADGRDLTFETPFVIGRTPECDVPIKDEYVSRTHARVSYENGQWWVRDLQSANGIYVEDRRIEAAPIERALTIRLGIRGPFVSFETQPQPVNLAEHYFGNSGEPAGERTVFIRQAFQQIQSKQKRKYGGVIALMAALVVGVAIFAFYQYQQTRHQRALAEDLFYSMKAIDLNIAKVERLVEDTQNQQGMQEIRASRDQRKNMARNYDRFLDALHIYDSRKMTPEERIVLRIARVFGECELDMPPGFAAEVHTYIQKWRSSKKIRKRDPNRYSERV